MNRQILSPLRQSCQRRSVSKRTGCGKSHVAKSGHHRETAASAADSESVELLGGLLCDQALAHNVLSKASPKQGSALVALAKQAVHSCIDYATLGLGLGRGHPTSRIAYWNGDGQSFSCHASRRRRAKSRKSIAALSNAMASAAQDAERETLLVAAFCSEISCPKSSLANANFNAVAAALEADLLLPLRALREGLNDMTSTLSGQPVPRAPLQKVVDTVTSKVLEGRFSEWRYDNPVGQAQLFGLSSQQRALWQEASSSNHGGLLLHEDAPGELGLFWATKIGGPSHGFDFCGQCLLPLLCNARHKVLLLSDPSRWAHPCGRAHLRLLWKADAQPPSPVLFLEEMKVDFAATKTGVSTEGWQEAALSHLLEKADRMGVRASVDPHLGPLLRWLRPAGKVTDVKHRLVLRPSNGVVEASDYLSLKHDWVQTEEEITEPLHRAVYEPAQHLENWGHSRGGIRGRNHS